MYSITSIRRVTKRKWKEELQKENEKLKEIDLTTVHIKGVCDEKERWRNKIKEKIEELEENLKDFEQTDNTGRFSREKSRDYDKKEVLEELLKGEWNNENGVC